MPLRYFFIGKDGAGIGKIFIGVDVVPGGHLYISLGMAETATDSTALLLSSPLHYFSLKHKICHRFCVLDNFLNSELAAYLPVEPIEYINLLVGFLLEIRYFVGTNLIHDTFTQHSQNLIRWNTKEDTLQRGTVLFWELQSGASSAAKHGGAYFSAVYGSIEDPVAAPGHCKPQVC